MVAAARDIIDEAARPPRSDRQIARRIEHLREEARYLVDEIFDWEAQLEFPPERICAGCGRHVSRGLQD